MLYNFNCYYKKHGTNDTGALNYFDSRGWLEETLQQMQLDLHSAQLLLWFDSFTGKEQAVIQDKMQSKTIIEHDFREDDKGFNSEGSLSVLLMELQQDFNEIKQGIVSVVQKDQRGKTEEQTEQWMTSKDVREMMQISKSTLIRYRKSGKIKCLRIGKNYRYKKNDILQTIKENENTISKQ